MDGGVSPQKGDKGMIRAIKFSQAQVDSMDQGTFRKLIEQVFFIETPRYFYSLGAQGAWWTVFRKDMGDLVGRDRKSQIPEFAEDAKAEIIDRWR